MDAIRTAGLVKTFGPMLALDGLDLEVATGEVHGFLGPTPPRRPTPTPRGTGRRWRWSLPRLAGRAAHPRRADSVCPTGCRRSRRFTHLPEVPAEPFELLPTLVLLVLTAAAVLVGLAGWQRRDVAT